MTRCVYRWGHHEQRQRGNKSIDRTDERPNESSGAPANKLTSAHASGQRSVNSSERTIAEPSERPSESTDNILMTDLRKIAPRDQAGARTNDRTSMRSSEQPSKGPSVQTSIQSSVQPSVESSGSTSARAHSSIDKIPMINLKNKIRSSIELMHSQTRDRVLLQTNLQVRIQVSSQAWSPLSSQVRYQVKGRVNLQIEVL